MTPGDRLHAVFKAGAQARRDGTVTPYPANNLLGQIHSYGWVREDLRLALMKANPVYLANQEAFARYDASRAVRSGAHA